MDNPEKLCQEKQRKKGAAGATLKKGDSVKHRNDPHGGPSKVLEVKAGKAQVEGYAGWIPVSCLEKN